MTRTIVTWALVLALGALALQWLEYRFLVRAIPPAVYVTIIGGAFAIGGVWVGWKLSARTAPGPYERNTAALASLGLTGQEVKVLEKVAAGQSNKEIARTLGLSLDNLLRFEIGPASLSRLEAGAWGARVLSLNETARDDA